MVHFDKYSATGNDFFLIDNRDGKVSKVAPTRWERLCHRRFGIGSDGLILLEKPTRPDADLRMRYHNADGSECSMCGNGSRALIHFAAALGIKPSRPDGVYRLQTMNGLYEAKLTGDEVQIKMVELKDVGAIAVEDLYLSGRSLFLDTGVPHAVFEVEDVAEVDVKSWGEKIAHQSRFPGATNVNFFQVKGERNIAVRTFERGVEDETLACGTGVTAVAIACQRFYGWQGRINVQVPGGELAVELGPEACSVEKWKKYFPGKSRSSTLNNMRTLTFILALLCFPAAHAGLKLNVSIIHMKGVSQELVLTSELHAAEIVENGGQVALVMNNRLRYFFRAFFVDSPYESGPSGMLNIQGEIGLPKGQIKPLIECDEGGRPLKGPVLTRLGGEKHFLFDDQQGGQRVEIVVRPLMAK